MNSIQAGPKQTCDRLLLAFHLHRAKLIPSFRTAIQTKDIVTIKESIHRLWAYRKEGYPRATLAAKIEPDLEALVDLLDQSLRTAETANDEMESLVVLYKVYFLSSAEASEGDLDFYSSLQQYGILPALPIQEHPIGKLQIKKTQIVRSRIRQIYFGHETATNVLRDQVRKDYEDLKKELRRVSYRGSLALLRATIGAMKEIGEDSYRSEESSNQLEKIKRSAQILMTNLEQVKKNLNGFESALEPLEEVLGAIATKYSSISSLHSFDALIDEAARGVLENLKIEKDVSGGIEPLIKLVEMELDDEEATRFRENLKHRLENIKRAWTLGLFSSLRDGRKEEVTRLLKNPPFVHSDLNQLTEPHSGKTLTEIVVSPSDTELRDQILALINPF